MLYLITAPLIVAGFLSVRVGYLYYKYVIVPVKKAARKQAKYQLELNGKRYPVKHIQFGDTLKPGGKWKF